MPFAGPEQNTQGRGEDPELIGPEPVSEREAGRRALTARPPVATLGLMVLIAAVAGAQFYLAGGKLDGNTLSNFSVDWALGAKVPSLVAHGEYWRLVTANFLHGSWLHLGVNLCALLGLGRMVELFYGRTRMLVVFVLGSVSGAITSFLLTPSVSLGASTGVMALFGALVVHHYRYRRYLPSRVRQFYPTLLLILFFQLVFDRANPQIDAYGHLGGLAGGMALGALLEGRIAGAFRKEREWLPLSTAVTTMVVALAYGVGGLATTLPHQMELIQAGQTTDVNRQADLLEAVSRKYPHFLELNRPLVELLRRAGRMEEAVRYVRVLRDGAGMHSYRREELDQMAAECFQRATVATANRRYETALPDYLRAAELTNSEMMRAEAYNGYAWTLAEYLQRNYDEAERMALKAVEANPGSSAIADTLAWVYYRQERYREALDRQITALQLAQREAVLPLGVLGSPQYAELFYHLGAISEKLGKVVDARNAYFRATQMRRPYPEAEQALARIAPPPPPTPTAPQKEVPPSPDMDPAYRRGVL